MNKIIVSPIFQTSKKMAESSAHEKNSPTEHEENALFKTVEVDGDIFPSFPVKIPTEDHIRNIRTMPMREDDIIIAAFPKCGTHWIWEVAQMLIAGKAEHDPRPKENVMLEFIEVEHFEPLPSPRVLNSHLFLRHLSRELVTKRSRVIHVIRNPKDVAVSSYFHLIQIKGVEDIGVVNYAKACLKGGMMPGSYTDYFVYMQEMMKWQREHPEVPVINIYFEDAKKDPVQCVEQIAKFLQVDASKELCEAIADQCSFHKMKTVHVAIKDKNTPDVPLVKDGVPKLYRKGEVGDWKNHFTVALSEEYDRVVPEKLKGCDLKFKYTI